MYGHCGGFAIIDCKARVSHKHFLQLELTYAPSTVCQLHGKATWALKRLVNQQKSC